MENVANTSTETLSFSGMLTPFTLRSKGSFVLFAKLDSTPRQSKKNTQKISTEMLFQLKMNLNGHPLMSYLDLKKSSRNCQRKNYQSMFVQEEHHQRKFSVKNAARHLEVHLFFGAILTIFTHMSNVFALTAKRPSPPKNILINT